MTWRLYRAGVLDQFQFPVAPYRLDYAWPELKVNLEVDGMYHLLPGAAERDAERDRYLRAQGWLVLRIDVGDTLAEQLVRICQTIRTLRELDGRQWSQIDALIYDVRIATARWRQDDGWVNPDDLDLGDNDDDEDPSDDDDEPVGWSRIPATVTGTPRKVPCEFDGCKTRATYCKATFDGVSVQVRRPHRNPATTKRPRCFHPLGGAVSQPDITRGRRSGQSCHRAIADRSSHRARRRTS